MAKGEVFRIRMSKEDKENLERVAKQQGEEGVSASEFARVAINNRVKRLDKKITEPHISGFEPEA